MENIEVQKEFKVVEFYKKNSLVLNLILLSLLFLANCFFAFVTYIALPLAFIMLIFSNMKNGLSYIIYIFPFVWFVLEFGMIMLIVCLVAWIAKLIYVKAKKEKVQFKISKTSLIIALVCFVFCFVPISGIYNIHILIKAVFIITILALIYLMIKFPEEFRLRHNLCILALALLVASLFALFRPVSDLLQSIIPLFTLHKGTIIRYSALFYNPNNLGLICEIGMSILTYYFIANKASKRDIFSFLVFLMLGILTFSKAFAVVCIVIVSIFSICAIKNKSKIIGATVALSILGAMIVFLARPDFFLVYLNRLSIDTSITNASDALNAITTDRFDVWLGYINHLLSNPLALIFGAGLGAPRIGNFSPHNVLLSTFYQLGIVGVALIVVAIVFVVKDANKNLGYKISKAIYMPLLMMTILSFIEDFIMYVA